MERYDTLGILYSNIWMGYDRFSFLKMCTETPISACDPPPKIIISVVPSSPMKKSAYLMCCCPSFGSVRFVLRCITKWYSSALKKSFSSSLPDWKLGAKWPIRRPNFGWISSILAGESIRFSVWVRGTMLLHHINLDTQAALMYSVTLSSVEGLHVALLH